MSARAPSSQGLLASLTMLAESVHAVACTRLELLSLDLDESRVRLTSMLFIALGAMVAIGIGGVLSVIALLMAIPDERRLALVVAIAAALLLVGFLACALVLRRAQQMPSIFSTSLSTLEKDRRTRSPR